MEGDTYIPERVMALFPALFTCFKRRNYINLSDTDMSVLESYFSGASIEDLSFKYRIPKKDVQNKLKEIRSSLIGGPIIEQSKTSSFPVKTISDKNQDNKPKQVYVSCSIEINKIIDSRHGYQRCGVVTVHSGIVEGCPTKFSLEERELTLYKIHDNCRCSAQLREENGKWHIANISNVQLDIDAVKPNYYKPTKKNKKVSSARLRAVDYNPTPKVKKNSHNPEIFVNKVSLVNRTGLELNSRKKTFVNGRIVNIDEVDWSDNG